MNLSDGITFDQAKNALRRKRTLEKILEKREGAVETIHNLIQRIKDAESDKMVGRIMRDSSKDGKGK